MKEPTNCDTCSKSLDNGYVYHYENNKLVKASCFKCDDKERFNSYLSNKKLTTRLVEANSLFLFHLDMKKDWSFNNDSFLEELKTRIDIQLSYSQIQNQIKEFEKEVWFKGLQEIVNKSKVKGISAHPNIFNNFCVLTYSIAGRTMITIQDDNSSVTFLTDEDSKKPCMGFQGINATKDQALSLIRLAIELYHNEGGTRLKFEKDTSVSMGI